MSELEESESENIQTSCCYCKLFLARARILQDCYCVGDLWILLEPKQGIKIQEMVRLDPVWSSLQKSRRGYKQSDQIYATAVTRLR